MKALLCEMCNSNDLIKQDGVFVCQNCGCKYSVEEAKKMMIQGTVDVSGSVVKVDNSDELRNLYELARRAKADDNSTNAQKYYEQILLKDPQSWEANFYSTYYQSMNCKIAEIGLSASRVLQCIDTVYTLIKDNVTDDEAQREAIADVVASVIVISNMLFYAYKNHYDGIDATIQNKFVQEYANNCSLCMALSYKGGDALISIFGDKYGMLATQLWRLGVKQHNILNGVYVDKQGNAETIKSYNEKIKKYDSTYVAPETNMKQDGGCYVATAVYGSYDCPEVWTLRRFRDNTLAETWYGRAFIHTYYSISPTLVKWFGNTEWFKCFWKPQLDKLVNKLNEKGVENTQYDDRQW